MFHLVTKKQDVAGDPDVNSLLPLYQSFPTGDGNLCRSNWGPIDSCSDEDCRKQVRDPAEFSVRTRHTQRCYHVGGGRVHSRVFGPTG